MTKKNYLTGWETLETGALVAH